MDAKYRDIVSRDMQRMLPLVGSRWGAENCWCCITPWESSSWSVFTSAIKWYYKDFFPFFLNNLTLTGRRTQWRVSHQSKISRQIQQLEIKNKIRNSGSDARKKKEKRLHLTVDWITNCLMYLIHLIGFLGAESKCWEILIQASFFPFYLIAAFVSI